MGRAVFPPCYLTWGQTMVEIMKIMATSFKRSHVHTAALSAPNPAAGNHQPTPPPETPGHSQGSQGQSLVGSLLLSPGSWCAQGFICALQESVSPVLCLLWQLYCDINGNLLQKGLCHTQVYCTQSPCPCSSPLLTHTSTGEHSNIIPSKSLWGLWVLVCTGLFEPSECLWQVWDLNLKQILSLLPSCWGFFFALGHGVSLRKLEKPGEHFM